MYVACPSWLQLIFISGCGHLGYLCGSEAKPWSTTTDRLLEWPLEWRPFRWSRKLVGRAFENTVYPQSPSLRRSLFLKWLMFPSLWWECTNSVRSSFHFWATNASSFNNSGMEQTSCGEEVGSHTIDPLFCFMEGVLEMIGVYSGWCFQFNDSGAVATVLI